MTEIAINADRVVLPGTLEVPENASGIVLFAHGSGSSRYSPRNREVASHLTGVGLGTLLFDLLTVEEAEDRSNVFEVELLARRLRAATAWVRGHDATSNLVIGYFGASTGAGAALWAAAEEGDGVAAVVSRGGRPDLAKPVLDRVTAPTMLIVGELDRPVIGMNQDAQSLMTCPNDLEIVPGASHLFEEPGTLGRVSALAAGWFARHLSDVPR